MQYRKKCLGRQFTHRICVICGMFFMLAALTAQAAEAGRQEAQMTLMIYMCGSDLEEKNASATRDLMEMMQSGFDPRSVNVLVMTGGSQTWASGYSADETGIYRVMPGSTIRLTASDRKNMGDPDTLTQLLRYGYEECPAKKYALILWDHGGGPMNGICWDTLSDGDHLTMEELDNAMRESPFAGEMLEWVGFDACLMASIETAHVMAPYARYMIASQELEPSHGWNYAFLQDLEKDASGAETGERIVDLYMESAQAEEPLTLSCCSLGAAAAVEEQMDEFFGKLSGLLERNTFSRLSNERQAARGFGKSIEPEDDYDLVDLADLIGHYDLELPQEGEKLRGAISDMVLYSKTNLEHSSGLSVYHPYGNKALFREEWEAGSGMLLPGTGYTDYIRKYAQIWLGQQLASWSSLGSSGETQEGNEHTFTFQLTEEQAAAYASADLLIVQRSDLHDGTSVYEAMYMDDSTTLSEDHTLSCTYGGRMLYAVDANNEPITTPVGYRIEDGQYVILAYYIDMNGVTDLTSTHVLFYCEPEEDGSDLRIVKTLTKDPTSGLFTNRIDIVPEDYDTVFFRHLIRRPSTDGNGDLKAFRDWEESEAFLANTGNMDQVNASADWHFRFLEDQLYDEDLYASFQITDTQGVTHSSALAEVNNEGIVIFPTEQILEDEDCRVSLKTLVYSRDKAAKLELQLEVTNLSDQTTCFWVDIGKTLVNHNRVLYARGWDDRVNQEIEPGGTKRLVFSYGPDELVGLDRILAIEMNLNLNRSEDAIYLIGEIEPELEKSLEVSYLGLDVSQIAEKCSPEALARTEADGMLYELRSLKQEKDGSIDGILYCRNKSDQVQTHTFDLPGINGCLVRSSEWQRDQVQEYSIDFSIDADLEMYIPFTLTNSRALAMDSFFGYYFQSDDPIGAMGFTQIEQLLFLEEADLWDPEAGRFILKLDLMEPVSYTPVASHERVLLLEDDGFALSCYEAGRAEGDLVFTIEIENRLQEEQIFTLLDASVDGSPAQVGEDLFFQDDRYSLHVPGGMRYQQYLFLNAEEQALGQENQQETGDALRAGFRVLKEADGRYELYYCEMDLGRIAGQIKETEGKGFFPDLDVKAGKGYASEDGNAPVISSQIRFPENSAAYSRQITATIPQDRLEEVSSATALIVYRADQMPLPMTGDKVLPADSIMPLAGVKLSEKDGNFSGWYSGLVLCLDQTKCVMADGEELPQCIPMLEQPLHTGQPSLTRMSVLDRTMQLYSGLFPDMSSFTLQVSMGVDLKGGRAATSSVRLVEQYAEGEELIDWPASAVDEFTSAMIYYPIEEQADHSFQVVPVGDMTQFCPAEDTEVEGITRTLTFLPAQEYASNIWVAYAVEYKDGTWEYCGLEPY